MQPEQSVFGRGEWETGFRRKVRRMSRSGMLMGVAIALVVLPPFVMTAYADYASCVTDCRDKRTQRINAAIDAYNLARQQAFNDFVASRNTANTAYDTLTAVYLTTRDNDRASADQAAILAYAVCLAIPPPADLVCAGTVTVTLSTALMDIDNTYTENVNLAGADRINKIDAARNTREAKYANALLAKNAEEAAALAAFDNCVNGCPPDG